MHPYYTHYIKKMNVFIILMAIVVFLIILETIK